MLPHWPIETGQVLVDELLTVVLSAICLCYSFYSTVQSARDMLPQLRGPCCGIGMTGHYKGRLRNRRVLEVTRVRDPRLSLS